MNKLISVKKSDTTEVWENEIYRVRKTQLAVEELDCIVAHLTISRHDLREVVDWRHKQQIKNQLLGEQEEAVEIFPPEKDLVDAVNAFHLWSMVGKRTGLGWSDGRRVFHQDATGRGGQRAFENPPDDLQLLAGRDYDRWIDFFKAHGTFLPDTPEHIQYAIKQQLRIVTPMNGVMVTEPKRKR